MSYVINIAALAWMFWWLSRGFGIKWKVCVEHHMTEHGDVRSISLLRIVVKQGAKS